MALLPVVHALYAEFSAGANAITRMKTAKKKGLGQFTPSYRLNNSRQGVTFSSDQTVVEFSYFLFFFFCYGRDRQDSAFFEMRPKNFSSPSRVGANANDDDHLFY